MSTEPAGFEQLRDEILRWKERRNAVILAHVYQPPEIQELADYVGDSLGLSQQAAGTDADVIVFCGVHFMAETAAILSPEKVVLLPEPAAGCPMADMVTVSALRDKRREMPGAVVVCYVNSSAEVKAESDICCTSANAVRIVESLGDVEILFVPDRNLAHYVSRFTRGRVVPWDGYCPTHDRLTPEELRRTMAEYPRAEVLVHPECRPEVIEMADFVGSTSAILRRARQSKAREFIVGTEEGILYQLYKQNPGKQFYLASPAMVCPNMKRISLEKVLRSLRDLTPQIRVPEEVRQRALRALEAMLERS